MIKQYFEITLRDWDIMEKSGNISRFRNTWNILPVIFFKKRIEKVRTILINKLNEDGGKSEDLAKENALWKLESLNNINGIRANYMGLMNELKYKPELNSLKAFYQKYTWRRLRLLKNNHAERYIKGIKKFTGIEIKTYEDVERVRKLLEFKTDKYNENFKPKQNEESQEKVYLMGFALGVFSRLHGIAFNPSQITVIEFIDAKKEVLKMNLTKQER